MSALEKQPIFAVKKSCLFFLVTVVIEVYLDYAINGICGFIKSEPFDIFLAAGANIGPAAALPRLAMRFLRAKRALIQLLQLPPIWCKLYGGVDHSMSECRPT
jgi:hypothetical protein